MKVIKLALPAIFLAFALTGCTIYEEGPLFSLLSKKDRIANTWEADKVIRDDGTDITNDYKNWTWTFTKDGDATIEYLFLGAPITGSGTWNLVDDDETFQLIIEGGWFGDNVAEYEILRLTNDEFWVVAEDGTEFRLDSK